MKQNDILLRVYASAHLIVLSILMVVCLCLGYNEKLLLVELSASIPLCAPPVVALHLVFILVQRTGLRGSAAWMLLLAALPLLSLLPAWIFAPLVPGKMLVLAGLILLSSYAGLLRNGTSIMKRFNTIYHEHVS